MNDLIKLREVSENWINNSIKVLIGKIVIRYFSKIVKLGWVIYILEFLIKICRVKSADYYFYKINILRLKYFKESIFFSSTSISKIAWANFILNNSKDTALANYSSFYLNLYKNKSAINSKVLVSRKLHYSEVNSKYFYIYGPNSSSPPNNNLNKTTLVLTKTTDLDISSFYSNILFLNYYTFSRLSHEELNNIHIKYKEIIISTDKKIIFPWGNFETMKPTGTDLASPMSLGRILQYLTLKNVKPSIIIEGFDLYSNSICYSKIINTLMPLENKLSLEKTLCRSLLDHDAEFNFLFIKQILESTSLYESKDFLEILNQTSSSYMTRLHSVRNYELLY